MQTILMSVAATALISLGGLSLAPTAASTATTSADAAPACSFDTQAAAQYREALAVQQQLVRSGTMLPSNTGEQLLQLRRAALAATC